MDRVKTYLELADSQNTLRSYASAVAHFERHWGGSLPTTPETIARYLADCAAEAATSTLRVRLAGLSRWHIDHGFADPTKSPMLTKLLRGIRTAHQAPQKQARPLEFDQLKQVINWLRRAAIEKRTAAATSAERVRRARDRAMLLIGYWRGFRSDELTELRVENIVVSPGESLSCFLPRSKGDREAEGRLFVVPALQQLCPVAAYQEWISVSGLTEGPVFRAIGRWGAISSNALAVGSINAWLRNLFEQAGIDSSNGYSSHSLRRGFANWARSSGWDLKDLMEYIGWTDIKSAMRYLEVSNTDLKARFNEELAKAPPSVEADDTYSTPAEPKLVEISEKKSHLTLIK